MGLIRMGVWWGYVSSFFFLSVKSMELRKLPPPKKKRRNLHSLESKETADNGSKIFRHFMHSITGANKFSLNRYYHLKGTFLLPRCERVHY